jgi:alcohol dehydrogenase class IV
MRQTLLARGAAHQIPALVARRFGRRVVVVAGRRSYQVSGAEAAIARSAERLDVAAVSRDHRELPTLDDALRTAALIRDTRPEAILAVGGGAVIDVAKAAAAIAASDGDPLEVVHGRRRFERPVVPLVAVPTTAGSGSEATQFAVVYVGETKYSVVHPSLRPALAIIDPVLSASVPRDVAAASGLDALVHGVESFLAVAATPTSQELAAAAIRDVLRHLPRVLRGDTSQALEGMCRAAHTAGTAINQTRTAAAHALSYALTARYGVRHGHAVAMLLSPVLEHNSRVTDLDVADSRGAAYVRLQVARVLEMFGVNNVAGVTSVIDGLLAAGGLATRLSTVLDHEEAVRSVADAVNAERLANNPRRCTGADLLAILRTASGARSVHAA